MTLRRVGPRLDRCRRNVDRVGVEQAFANLVLNAIEAAPASGGEVAVSLSDARRWRCSRSKTTAPASIREIADRLFEPFETTKPRGMGLGLPLAKEIAARHGGASALAPVVAAGRAIRTGAAARMSPRPPARRRVFIVDDEPEIRDALTLLLSTAGVETEEYASAEGFWENAPHDEPYCVVLDNRLPGHERHRTAGADRRDAPRTRPSS